MSLFQKMSAQKMTKKLVSICKRCYSIRLFEVSLDFCIEDEKEKIKSNTSNWSMPALNTGKWQVVTHTFTVFTSMASGVTWSGGSGGVVNHQFNFNYSITPLVCPDCPQGECDICFLEHEA